MRLQTGLLVVKHLVKNARQILTALPHIDPHHFLKGALLKRCKTVLTQVWFRHWPSHSLVVPANPNKPSRKDTSRVDQN
jgi:hypothetical protein